MLIYINRDSISLSDIAVFLVDILVLCEIARTMLQIGYLRSVCWHVEEFIIEYDLIEIIIVETLLLSLGHL